MRLHPGVALQAGVDIKGDVAPQASIVQKADVTLENRVAAQMSVVPQ